MTRRLRRRKGGVLVMFAIAMVVIIACSGLAIDVGRMYVTRTEAQSFVDALALARAAEYIGARTPDASDVWKRYNFNNDSFEGQYVVEYSATAGFTGTVTTAPPASGNVFVRATATVDVPLLLLKVLVPDDVGTVRATAVAGVEQLTSTGEGTFPYAIRKPPTGGFVQDEQYTFRWGNNVSKDLEDAWKYVQDNIAAEADLDARMTATATVLAGGVNPFPGKNPPNVNVWCSGHATKDFLLSLGTSFDTVPSDLFSWNGGFFQGGTNNIVAAMAYGYQDQVVTVDEAIVIATGVRQATVNELQWVINQDTDTTSNTRLTYSTGDPIGNGYRVIEVAVVDAASSAYVQPGSGATATVVALEAFLLLQPDDYGNPQSNWCAAYYGAIEAGTEDPIEQPSGIWVLRLIS